VETYLLMGICLGTWVVTFAIFKFVVEDPEYGTIFGSLAGLILAIAAGGAYYVNLASCSLCN
jgi:hypothetical protein